MPTGHEISTASAAALTARFRMNREAILDTEYQNQDILALCETFDKSAFAAMMQDENCTSIRIYYGMDVENKVHAIIVGVNDSDEDMLPANPDEEADKILEDGHRCPEACPPSSVLNSD